MAKAIQCDRCKKFSVIEPDNQPLPAVEKDAPSWEAITVGTVSHTICDACSQDFIDFMKNTDSVAKGAGVVRISKEGVAAI